MTLKENKRKWKLRSNRGVMESFKIKEKKLGKKWKKILIKK